jgi:Amt family ammonium transporter
VAHHRRDPLRQGLGARFRLGPRGWAGDRNPASGFVGPMGAIAIGTTAGLACYGAVMLKSKLNYDDTLDAFGVHGVGGAVGTILLGVFATKAWNASGADGLITGDVSFLGKQLLAVAVTVAFSVAGTLVILKVVDATVGLRVTADEEREGLDINLHGEEGYSIGSSTYGRSDMAVAPEAAEPTGKTSPAVVS